MRGHWPSKVREEWQVGDGEYEGIARRVVADITAGASKGRKFLRLAGQSGSGKTTQLLPVAKEMVPSAVLVAARKFVKYHPYAKEIEAEYGKENLRSKTDEFSTIMMFLTLKALVGEGYDIVLDVTLLDVLVEGVLQRMLAEAGYEARMMMMAVSREISDGFILKRTSEKKRKVAKSTAEEFWRAQGEAVRWYATQYPEMRVSVWSAFDLLPVYDGEFGGAVGVIEKYWAVSAMPEDAPSEVELLGAKMAWAGKNS